MTLSTHREHGHDRPARIAAALRLESLTLAWNLIEGTVAVFAAVAAGSVALFAFGIDSFVESASAGVLVWRLRAERRDMDARAIERLEHRAQRLVAASLFLLAAYVAIDAAFRLGRRERPETSAVGIALLILSLVAMAWLARAKRRAAAALGSRALEADAFQTTACFWLSLLALAGLGLTATLGWWWADPVAALAMCVPIVWEGREAWRGRPCSC
jgi:divalent metal cation (Fe/Co/Zn/Cd) transporter